MTGFDDLLVLGQPFVHTEEMAETAGFNWTWGYGCLDDNTDPVDMTTGYTGTCIVKDENGATVIEVPVTFPQIGVVMCQATAEETDGVTTGTHAHEVAVTRTSDSARLLVISPGGSSFIVLPKGS